MLSSRPARRQAILYVFLLAISLLLLAFSGSAPVQELRQGIGFALSPVQNVMRDAAQGVNSFFATIGEIERLRQQNADLTRRQQELEAENRRLASLAFENQQLTELLEIRSSLAYSTVAAEVSSRRTTDQERVISLDRGTESGIAEDDPVVAGGGALVGLVIEAGTNYSRVLLISDTRMNVAGLIEASRATGNVHGQAERPLEMTGIAAVENIAHGEAVVTAGIQLSEDIASLYPKGLLIGQIVDVRRSPDQLFQSALVQPAAPLDTLEYVLVITDYQAGQPAPSPGPSPDAGASPATSPGLSPAISPLPLPTLTRSPPV